MFGQVARLHKIYQLTTHIAAIPTVPQTIEWIREMSSVYKGHGCSQCELMTHAVMLVHDSSTLARKSVVHR